MKKYGFTLIELLIVVAIIAILAAIAVPNFLSAQTRAKVARTLADMRALDTAYNAYYIDYNKSPIISNNDYPVQKVTTPIAYITTWPQDVFRSNDPTNYYVAPYLDLPKNGIWPWSIRWLWLYPYTEETAPPAILQNGGVNRAFFANGDQFPGAKMPASYLWGFSGIGPDRVLNLSAFSIYDPSNGTISPGDIWRVGPGGSQDR